MYCSYCRKELPTDTTAICPNCNTPIVSSQPISSQQTKNSMSIMAIMSLVVGALSLSLWCGLPLLIPLGTAFNKYRELIFVLFFALAPVAIILSIVELKRIKTGRSSPTGRFLTITGMLMGIASISFAIFALILLSHSSF